MQSMSSSTERFLENLSAENPKALRIAKNNTALRKAIERTWGTQPDAARWLLSQINALYLEYDERPRKRNAPAQKPVIMKLYVRDATARAELNAKRETLQIILEHYGLKVSEIRLLQARGDAKNHRLFSDEILKESADAQSHDTSKAEAATRHNQYVEQMELLESLKRAVCLSFDDPDEAYALLNMVEGARLDALKNRSGRRRNRNLWYRAYFYTAPEQVSELKELVSAFEDTVKSKARRVELNLIGITVEASPASLSGKLAFPRTGQPVPYFS